MSLAPTKIRKIRNLITGHLQPVDYIAVPDAFFRIEFSSQDIPSSFEEQLIFLNPLITAVTPNKEIAGDEFLSDLPCPLFFYIFHKYQIFHQSIVADFHESLAAYVATPESKNLWRVYKAAGPEYLFSQSEKYLTSFQETWIVYNTHADQQDQFNLITDVFDAAKPWLSPEMWQKMREREDATRENWQYDDAEIDARLQRQADTILKKKQPVEDSDDLDIIEVEENTNNG